MQGWECKIEIILVKLLWSNSDHSNKIQFKMSFDINLIFGTIAHDPMQLTCTVSSGKQDDLYYKTTSNIRREIWKKYRLIPK